MINEISNILWKKLVSEKPTSAHFCFGKHDLYVIGKKKIKYVCNIKMQTNACKNIG